MQSDSACRQTYALYDVQMQKNCIHPNLRKACSIKFPVAIPPLTRRVKMVYKYTGAKAQGRRKNRTEL